MAPGVLVGGSAGLLEQVDRARADSASGFAARRGIAALLAHGMGGSAPVRAYVPLDGGAGGRTAEDVLELFGGDALAKVLTALGSAEALAVGITDDRGALRVRIDAPLGDESAARAAANGLELLGGLAGPLARGTRRARDRARLEALAEMVAETDGRFVALSFPVPRQSP
jgi:hypothetical protein